MARNSFFGVSAFQISPFGELQSGSEIRITPISIDTAAKRLESLRSEAEGIKLNAHRQAGSGPGSEALEQLGADVTTLRDALAEMIGRTQQALTKAKDEFVATDERIAGEIESLGAGNLL